MKLNKVKWMETTKEKKRVSKERTRIKNQLPMTWCILEFQRNIQVKIKLFLCITNHPMKIYLMLN